MTGGIIPTVNAMKSLQIDYSKKCYWWLVRATNVVDGQLFCHLFLKVEGTVHIHINSCAATYMVINMQDGGRVAFQTSVNSEIFKFKLRWQGALMAISDLMNGSHLQLSKMAASQNKEFYIKCIFVVF